MTVADFDGVTYHISTPESKSVIHISLGWACTGELFSHGAKEVLKREYGDLLLDTPEQGYDVTLSIDLETISKEPGNKTKYKHKYEHYIYLYHYRGKR